MLKDEAYYRALGALEVNAPMQYCDELIEAIGVIPPGHRAVEIGGGVSPYVNLLQSQGYTYTLVEPNFWACSETKARYLNVNVIPTAFPFEGSMRLFDNHDLVLAAHVLEHIKNLRSAMEQINAALVPGGHLIIIVPDDTDQWNPDHVWFFNERSLRHLLIRFGFEVLRMSTHQRVTHEKFIYCLGKKTIS
jgi:SAM-dependent methyltransferase